MMKSEIPNNEMAKALTNDPAHLAGGTTQKLLDRISFDTGEGLKKPSVEGFVRAIQSGTRAIQKGDLSHLEAILYAQIETLNAVFQVSLNQANASQYLESVRYRNDCALKAQNQCRRTVLALAELKNPKRATFIKQQNNAINQQINSENYSQSENEIYEAANVEKVDGEEPQAAGGVDPDLETLGINNGTQNNRREKAVIEK